MPAAHGVQTKRRARGPGPIAPRALGSNADIARLRPGGSAAHIAETGVRRPSLAAMSWGYNPRRAVFSTTPTRLGVGAKYTRVEKNAPPAAPRNTDNILFSETELRPRIANSAAATSPTIGAGVLPSPEEDDVLVPAFATDDAAELEPAAARLRKWNSLAALMHLSSWVVMLGFLQAYDVFQKFNLPVYRTANVFNDTFIETESHQIIVGHVNLPVFIAPFSLISGIMHLVAALGAERVLDWARNGANWLRWSEYAISAALCFFCVAVLTHVKEYSVLVAITTLYSLCMPFGGIAEDYAMRGDSASRWKAVMATMFSSVGFLAGWLVVFSTFFSSVAASPTQLPAFVYTAFILLFVFNCAFPVIHVVKLVHIWSNTGTRLAPSEAARYELYYIFASFGAKQSLAWSIYGAGFQALKLTDVAVPAESYSTSLLLTLCFAGASWCVVVAAWYADNQNSLAHLWGRIANSTALLRRYYAAMAIVVPMWVAHAVIAVIAIDDPRRLGYVAAIPLGLHIATQAAYIACADRIMRGTGKREVRSSSALNGILWSTFAFYTAYYVLTVVFAQHLWQRVTLGVLGAFVATYLVVFDAYTYLEYAL